MSDLHQLQLRFQDYLTGGSDDIEADIVSTADAPAEHRLGTYFNAYRIRLIDCLAVEYAALQQCLGGEAFENLALDYLQHYPSSHPSVRWFGQHLPAYLADIYKGDDEEFLLELARYEWSKSLVFDARNSDQLFHPEQMAEVPVEAWPTIRFHFKTAIQWLDCYWNIAAIENAVELGEAMPDKQRGDHPVRWLLWRKQMRTHWRSLDVHEAWAIEQAMAGANFEQICEGLCEWIDAEQVALAAAGFLKQWLSDDLIEALDYNA